MKNYLTLSLLLAVGACSETQQTGSQQADSQHNAALTEEASLETPSTPQDEPQTATGDLIPGVYHVHQLSSSGFAFQYKFELNDKGEYKMFDKTGSFEYDPATNIIRFTSGGLNEYNGMVTRIDHLNESRNLMIVLDFQGGIPDTLSLGKKPGGYYQYAYYQQP